MNIYFNSLGVLTSSDTTADNLRQGNVGNQLHCFFEGKSNINYIATFNLTRSDGSKVTGVAMSPNATQTTRFDYKFSNEWYFALAGTTTLTVYLTNAGGDVVANGQIQFSIEQTDFSGTTATISNTQYNALLSAIADKLGKQDAIICVPDISVETMTDYASNQVFFDKATKKFYKKSGSGYSEYAIKYIATDVTVNESMKVDTFYSSYGQAAIVNDKYFITCELGELSAITVKIAELSTDYFYKATLTSSDASSTNILSLISNEYRDTNLTLSEAKSKYVNVAPITILGSYSLNFVKSLVATDVFTFIYNGQTYLGYLVTYTPPEDETYADFTFIQLASNGQKYIWGEEELASKTFAEIFADPDLSYDYALMQHVDDKYARYYELSPSETLAHAYGVVGSYKQPYILKYNGDFYIGKIFSNGGSYYSAFIYSTSALSTYSVNYANGTTTKISDLISDSYRTNIASRTYVNSIANTKVDITTDESKIYGTDSHGEPYNYDIDHGQTLGEIVKRDNQQVNVPQTPTSNIHATSKKYVDDSIAAAISSAVKWCGSKTVAEINALTGQTVGDMYNVLSSGTITLGDFRVERGDNIVWNGTIWDKLAAPFDASNLQPLITSSNKLSADLVDDTNSTNKFVTTSEKTTWNSKANASDVYTKTQTDDLIEANKTYVDTELDSTSTNPVQNKVVVEALDNKCNPDGDYSGSGLRAESAEVADNLTPYSEESGNDQTEPFILEGAGTGNGSESVDTGSYAIVKEKRGNVVCVNQIQNNGDFSSSTGWTTTGTNAFSVSSNVATATYDGEHAQFRIRANASSTQISFLNTHKYLVMFDLKSSIALTNTKLGVYREVATKTYYQAITLSANTWKKYGFVLATSEDGTTGLNIGFGFYEQASSIFSKGDTFSLKNVQCIDLTQMFGAGKEPATADTFFRYYQGSLAYNEGQLVASNGRYLKSVGRNAYNPSETYNKVIPNREYFASKSTTITYYDKDKNSLGTENVSAKGIFTTPSDCIYINSSVSSITISLVYYKSGTTLEDGYIDGSNNAIEYPYEELENIDTGSEELLSAGSVYDSKLPSGEIIRRVGYVDLGTLDWSYRSENGTFRAGLTGMKAGVYNKLPNLICDKYTVRKSFYGNDTGYEDDKTITEWGSLNYLIVQDSSYTDAVIFKTAMSGVMLYYELATPTTQQGTSFKSTIAIDDFGSLLADDSSFNGVPMGNKIFYPVDYKAFVDSVYNRASGSASDLVVQTELTAVDEKIGAKIPECPTTTDGTYVLKATVSDGAVTYSWVAE